MRNQFKYGFELGAFTFLWILVQGTFWISAQTTSPIQITQVLWALGPCQSAFWIPNSNSEFNSNWITYLFEGNPISQSGECIFTLESDPNTRIEMVIQEVNLFGSESINPPPCLELYDVKQNGSIVLLKKECKTMLMDNTLESQPTFTEMNLGVISTTIRYGSFQLQARAVPRTYGFPTKVSSTTPTTTTSTTTSTPTTVTTSSNKTSATTHIISKKTSSSTTSFPTEIVTSHISSSDTQRVSDMLRYEFGNRKNEYNDI